MTAKLNLHPLFSDQAVLPREVPLPIHGYAVPGQTVKISFAGQQESARADATGFWIATLQPVLAGGPYVLTVSMSGRQLIRRDIYTGEVWLATGQANMEMPLLETADGRAVVAKANLPRIRFYSVPQVAAAEPESEGEGRWEKCLPEKAATFSALGFHFAKMMFETLECPIGIIQATWAGTSGLPWVPLDAMRSRPEFASIVRAPLLKAPANEKTPGALFNGMIAPLLRFPIRGVIAYQGETDVDRAHLYRSIFAAQIQGWRNAWRRNELPFLWVQLAGYSVPKADPGEDAWAEMREAQASALRLPATAMAVAADLGSRDSMKPTNKRAVAERLTLGALAVAYRRSMPYSGPLYHAHTVKNGAVHITFSHAESGLRARQAGPMMSFAIAGGDKVFRWADARVENGVVIVSHPAVAVPIAVRYAWEAQPTLTFENGAGLPAAPFRTDNWPGITLGRA